MSSNIGKFSLPIRLAFRAEGEFVNVYHEDSGAQDGIILLGSMRRVFLEENPQMWEEWKAMMLTAYCDALRRVGGSPFVLEETDVSLPERGGNA